MLRALSSRTRDVERANTHLREALDAGQSERLIRTIVDQAPGIHQLLMSCTPAAGQRCYVEDLLAATRRILPPARSAVVSSLVEPLSPRELNVLRYFCSQLTYREIAAALYVSVNTLKSHVRSIFRKLVGYVARRRRRHRPMPRTALIAADSPVGSRTDGSTQSSPALALALVGRAAPNAPAGRHALR